MQQILRHRTTKIATIAASGTVSSAIETQAEYPNMGLVLPATFTGTALTFQVSLDNGTYQALYKEDGSAVSMTVAQGRSYQLPIELACWPWFKIVSGSTEGSERTLNLTLQS